MPNSMDKLQASWLITDKHPSRTDIWLATDPFRSVPGNDARQSWKDNIITIEQASESKSTLSGLPQG